MSSKSSTTTRMASLFALVAVAPALAADGSLSGAIKSANGEALGGVTVSAITPQWKHDSDDYMTFECRVDAAGDLGKLSRFLYSVERDPMALKLELVELGARDKDGQQLSLGLQLSGLVLNTPTR